MLLNIFLKSNKLFVNLCENKILLQGHQKYKLNKFEAKDAKNLTRRVN